jgi:hypothetical protein
VERLADDWCPVTEVPTASASSLVSRIAKLVGDEQHAASHSP